MCPDVFILGLLAPLHVHRIEIPYRAFPERVGSLLEKEDRGSRIEDQRSRIEVGALAVLSTKFQYTIPSLTESLIFWTRKWNFPGKLNALFQ